MNTRAKAVIWSILVVGLLLTIRPAQNAQAQGTFLYLPMVSNGGSGGPPPPVVVIPETTEVLSEQTTDQLVDVLDEGAIFVFAASTAELAEVDPGDIIVGQNDTFAPEGFLRRVTGVNTTAGETVIVTEQAALEEAIDTGSLHAEFTLSPTNVVRSDMMPGVTMLPIERAGAAPDEFVYSLDNVVLYDDDLNTATKGDQLLASGEIRLTQDVSVDLDFKGRKLKLFEVILESETTDQLEIVAQFAGANKDGEKVLIQHYFSPLAFAIGPIPIIITPVMNILVGFDGSVQVGMRTELSTTSSYQTGYRWADGNHQAIADSEQEFTFTPPTLTAKASLEGYTGAEVILKFYGFIGPKAEVNLYLLAEADPFDTPWAKLYGGLKGKVGGKLEILKMTLLNFEVTTLNYRRLLWEADSMPNHPPDTPDAPTPPHGSTNRDTADNLAWSGGDPDGDTVTYDVWFESGDTTPDSLICSATTVKLCDPPGLLAQTTTYYWQVKATDSHGLTTTGPIWHFTTGSGGANQPPFVPAGASPPPGTTNTNIYVILGWQGGDPDGDSVSYDVYLEAGDNTPDALLCDGAATEACQPPPLAYAATYYWKVVATDSHGATVEGPVWQFQTRAEPEPPKTIDVALIIDSSSSMQWNDPGNMRLVAAKVFIDAMLSGDYLAAVQFDTNASVVWPLQVLLDDRGAPKAAVDTIDSYGSTNISDGLNTGYVELDSSPSQNPKVALLLTDGQHTEGAYDPQSHLQFEDRGWPIYTIGLSSSADAVLLQRIADDTGGQYFALDNPSDLTQIYNAIQAAVTGANLVVNNSFTMQQGQTQTVDATIAVNQNSANFVSTWPGSQVDMTLIDPNGVVITPATAGSNPDVYHNKGATFEVYRIAYPIPGDWQVQLYGADLAAGGEVVTLQVSERDNELPYGAWSEVGAGSAEGGGISHTPDTSAHPSLAFAPDGSLYVAWTETIGKKGEVYARRWDGAQWADVGVGSAGGGGISQTAGHSEGAEITVAADGTPYVAWFEETGADAEVYVRRWNGSAWVEAGAGSAAGGGVSNSVYDSVFPVLKAAPDGTVYIAWVESSATDNEIFVRRWNGSAWVEVGAGSAAGGGISNNSGDSGRPALAIDSTGVPYVGWTDSTPGNNEIYVRRWNGTTWEEVGVGSASGNGISQNSGASRPPKLATDSFGHVYVIWPDDSGGNFDVYARRWNGAQWEDVGAGSASGGGISATSGNTVNPDIAIGPDDVPYVAWYDATPGVPEIYVRHWTGTAWEETGVGSASGGGVSNNVGSSVHARLAVAADNVPYLLWNDNSGGNYEIYAKRWAR